MNISFLEKLISTKPLVPNNTKVGIVGAGLSGLLCGWILNHLGFEVNIYEASDRIGGRVHTIERQNRLIEAGGEFIGLNHPIWLLLAKYFGLEFESIKTDLNESVIIDDKILNSSEIEVLNQQVREVYMKMSEDANKISFPDQPWLESPDIQDLDHISIKDKFDEWNVQGDVRKMVEFYFSNENVSEVDKQSYLGLLCQIKGGSINSDTRTFWDNTELFRCLSGNQSLANELGESLNIKKNCLISKIKYENNHVICSSSDQDYVSDFLIVAVPPTVWKYIDFVNISDISSYTPNMGSAIKVINYELSTHFISTTIGQTHEPTERFAKILFSGGPQVNKALNQSGEIFNWPQEPHIRTGYSYAGLGKVITVGKLLYEPVLSYENKLLFAGEHTSMDFFGFMEGALQSGVRAALKIVFQIQPEFVS